MTKINKNLFFLILFGFFLLTLILFFAKLNSSSQPKPQKVFLNSDIDTTIVASTDDQYSYMNVNANFSTYFPNDFINLNSDIKFQKNDSSVSFSFLTPTKKQTIAQKDKNEIFYPKIFQDGNKYIDLKYTVYSNRLSEELILNQKQNMPEFSQKLNLFNAYISQQSDQQINFNHPATHETLWHIPAPIMYEQNNPNIKNSGIIYQIKCDDQSASLQNCRSLILTKKITPEGQAWLDDPNRNYPVIIDPNYELDDADGTYVNWLSSNTAVLVVSNETTIVQEGTASIKIVGTTIPGNCWGIGGACDSSCNNTSVGTSTTVYTTCTQGSTCSNTNCWTYESVCSADCDDNTYQSYWGYASASDCTNEQYPGYRWTFSGICSVDGSGYCYNKDAATGPYNWYINSPTCSVISVYGAHPTCTWIYANYPWTASNSTLRYAGNGTACNGAGSGTCYKLIPDDSNTYTGNTACGGGSTCAGAAIRNTAVGCTWYTSIAQSVGTQITAVDLSLANWIGFYVRANTTGSFLRFQIGENSSAEQTYDINITTANSWQWVQWDLSGITNSSLDSIKYMAFKVIDTAKTFQFYFDDLKTDIDLPASPSRCRIDQGTDNTTFNLYWDDNATTEEGFKLYKDTDSGGFSLLFTLGVNSTAYSDSDIAAGHVYGYKLFSFDTTLGTQVTSVACEFPYLSPNIGSFKMEGIKMEGIKIN